MADAAEAAVAGGDLGLQHRLCGVAEQQIDVADDAGVDLRLAIAAAGAHRGDAVGELDFAHRAERFRSAGAIHRAAVDIDGGDDVVAGGDVAGHVLDHVAQAAAVPEMVMRVDDRARRIDDVFGVAAQASLRADWRRARSRRRAKCWRPLSLLAVRHCEEQSDEAIQLCISGKKAGLLRFARNDGVGSSHPVQNDHRRRGLASVSREIFKERSPRRSISNCWPMRCMNSSSGVAKRCIGSTTDERSRLVISETPSSDMV